MALVRAIVLAAPVVLAVSATTPVSIPSKEIAPGVHLPMVSIGTGNMFSHGADANTSAIVGNWLDLGGSGIDTAAIYVNQKDVAKTISSRGKDRRELFITSKIPGCFGGFMTHQFVQHNLKALNTSYFDLLLIHFPPVLPGPIGGCHSTWKVLEEYHAKGVLRSIGVSNFNQGQLKALLKYARVRPALNQIQFNVFSHNDDTASFCVANGITLMAYSPMGQFFSHRSVFKDPVVKEIADSLKVSPPQVALRWIVQKGYPLAFMSSNKAHQANDADLFSFKLTDDHMKRLDQIQHSSSITVV